MKKILLVLTLMLTTLSYSQSRLWYTYAEIKKEFQNTYEFTTGYAEGLGKYLQFETGDAVVATCIKAVTFFLIKDGKLQAKNGTGWGNCHMDKFLNSYYNISILIDFLANSVALIV
jgi:hypothetical protein